MRVMAPVISGCVLLCAVAMAVCGEEQVVARKDFGFQISFPESCSVHSAVIPTGLCVIGNDRDKKLDRWSMITHVEVREAESEMLSSVFSIPKYRRFLEGGNLAGVDI